MLRLPTATLIANGALPWLVLGSAAMFVGSILVAWMLIVHMPADFLTRDCHAPTAFASRHPIIRWTWRIFRNVFGVLLVSVGLVMLVTPGQGILFIFLGATMVDFPRKQQVIRRLLGRKGVLNVINRVRRKANKPELTPVESSIT
ncbi:MAG: PGPGW domain-containing protein [Rubripirellula sp.]